MKRVDSHWRLVRNVIRKADVIVEVVDARDPLGTRSQEIEKMADSMGKPLIIVVNKADLVPKEDVEKWARILRKERTTVFISATKRLGTRFLWKILSRTAVKRPIVVAIVGVPNVGKSTIINYLKGAHSVGTSPIPGYTQHVTRLRVARWLRVLDTPGVVPRRLGELALVNALRPESLDDPVPVAVKFLELIAKKKPHLLKELYNIEWKNDGILFLEELARKRGLIGKGGTPLVEEAARIVIRDWQTGKNTFYLEPEDYGISANS
ncbi:MAG: GTPase [Infirmifilum sp.]